MLAKRLENNLQFRTPDESDIPGLSALGRKTFIESFGHLYCETDLQEFLERVHGEPVLRREMKQSGVLYCVVEEGGDLVGYIKIGPVQVPVREPSPRAMELRQIYLLQSHTGRGIGQQMVDWAGEVFARRNVDEVYVSVFSGNPRAIRFYEKQGFQKVGEYGFQVGKQFDREWIMCRKVGE